MDCAYCERPLICESCQQPYAPPSAEDYAAVSELEETITCPACGEVLVCHWCKTPYEPVSPEDAEGGGAERSATM